MNPFNAWVGNKESVEDVASPRPTQMLQALLNAEHHTLQTLPHLYHWLYFLPLVNNQHIAEDGHPHKGGFLPPIPFPKRMWAGSRVEFVSPIRLGQSLRRDSEILDIQFKQGKSGAMYFVTVEHRIYADDHLSIIEQQDIVYRDQTTATTATTATYSVLYPVNSVSLFRYSAITFNAHRIHYDRPYATEIEGYPGLVVHGPFLATLLIHHFKQHCDSTIKKFEFRAIQPVFDFDDVHVCGDVLKGHADLRIEKSHGQVCMQARVFFEE